MNQLMVGSPQQTMTSREIADLVESRHADVCICIERLIRSQAIGGYAAMPYTHPQNGQEYYEYHVRQRDSYVVVAQLSPQFTARLVDRWQELEATISAPAFAVPQTFAEALRLAADQQETIQQQAAQLAYAAPKVAFVEQYVDSTSGSKGFRQVCKLLGAKEPEFRAFLHDEKIMYKLGGEWVPFAQHMDAGRFEVKAGTSETSGHAYNSAKFTAKGVEWVAGEWAKHKIKGEV